MAQLTLPARVWALDERYVHVDDMAEAPMPCERCDGTGEVHAGSFVTPLPPMVGHVLDGPELVRCIECDGGGWQVLLDEAGEWTAARPATCNICEGAIEPDADLPLCGYCESVARAHARLEQDRIEAQQS